jgi:hypothetical protein
MNDHKPKKMTSAQAQEVSFLQDHINQLYKILGDVNNRLIAISRAKISAEILATFLLDGEANTKYMQDLNKEIDTINREKEKDVEGKDTLDGVSYEAVIK